MTSKVRPCEKDTQKSDGGFEANSYGPPILIPTELMKQVSMYLMGQHKSLLDVRRPPYPRLPKS